jgi:hypothetical protein
MEARDGAGPSSPASRADRVAMKLQQADDQVSATHRLPCSHGISNPNGKDGSGGVYAGEGDHRHFQHLPASSFESSAPASGTGFLPSPSMQSPASIGVQPSAMYKASVMAHLPPSDLYHWQTSEGKEMSYHRREHHGVSGMMNTLLSTDFNTVPSPWKKEEAVVMPVAVADVESAYRQQLSSHPSSRAAVSNHHIAHSHPLQYDLVSDVMIGKLPEAVPYVGANPFVDDFSNVSTPSDRRSAAAAPLTHLDVPPNVSDQFQRQNKHKIAER